jgi:hypothetical protein
MNKDKWSSRRIWEGPMKMFMGVKNIEVGHCRVQWREDFRAEFQTHSVDIGLLCCNAFLTYR